MGKEAGAFWGLVGREGLSGEGDLNGEPFAVGAVRTNGRPLALSIGDHALLKGGFPIIVGQAKLTRSGQDIFATGQIWADMDYGLELLKSLRHRGADAGLSLGYRIVAHAAPTAAQQAKGIIRVLTDVLPIELSPVLFPAQPWAHVLEVKSTFAEVEDRLALLLERRQQKLDALNQDADSAFARGRLLTRRLSHVA
ncbi:MAG: HK97 family phage prohead protease [Kofleriaceae bacterium]